MTTSVEEYLNISFFRTACGFDVHTLAYIVVSIVLFSSCGKPRNRKRHSTHIAKAVGMASWIIVDASSGGFSRSLNKTSTPIQSESFPNAV